MLLYLREDIPSVSFTKANKPIEYLKVLSFKVLLYNKLLL